MNYQFSEDDDPTIITGTGVWQPFTFPETLVYRSAHASNGSEGSNPELWHLGRVSPSSVAYLTPNEAETATYQAIGDSVVDFEAALAFRRSGSGAAEQSMTVSFLVAADANDTPGETVAVRVYVRGGTRAAATSQYSLTTPTFTHDRAFVTNSSDGGVFLVASETQTFPINVGESFSLTWQTSAQRSISSPLDVENAKGYIYSEIQVVAPDMVPYDLSWDYDPANVGGVSISHVVNNAPLTQDSTIALYWASGKELADVIGAPIYSRLVRRGFEDGETIQVSSETIGVPPEGATYLLAIADPARRVRESNEDNNIYALSLLPDLEVFGLHWLDDQRGVSIKYAVILPKLNSSPRVLEDDTIVELYWANGETQDDLLGSAFFTRDVEKTHGVYGEFEFSLGSVRPPAGATHVVAVIDREDVIAEGDEDNNVVAIPLPDLEPGDLEWNTDRVSERGMRGIDFSFDVYDADSRDVVKVAFYWASGPDYGSRIGGPVEVQELAGEGDEGSHGAFNEPARWGAPPSNARYVLHVVDPFHEIIESNEDNNVSAIQLRSASEILGDSVVFDLDGIEINGMFSPGAGDITMSEAEVALGVDHFNWIQHLIEMPDHWALYRRQPGQVFELDLPLLDPPNFVSNTKELVLVSELVDRGEPFADDEVDGFPFYYNEPGEIARYTDNHTLRFFDAPQVPDDFLQADEFWKFRIRLSGVGYQGQRIFLNEVKSFTWKSNTVFDRETHDPTGGGVFLRVTEEMLTPDPISGGVFDLMVEPQPPDAQPQEVSTTRNSPVPITLAGDDFDGDALTYIIVSGPAHGVLTGAAPNVVYTPGNNFSGPDSFTFKVHDGVFDSQIVTVSIVVNAGNSAPTNIQLSRDKIFSGIAGAWVAQVTVTDPDANDEHTFALSDDRFEVRDGHLFLKPDQTLALAPATVALTITASDAGPDVLSLAKTFTFTVEAPPANWDHAFQWKPLPLDVNLDGVVTPLDALLIINYLNAAGSTTLTPQPGGTLPPLFLDSSGDNSISPLDALLIINFLNATSGGEGESAEFWAEDSHDSIFDEEEGGWHSPHGPAASDAEKDGLLRFAVYQSLGDKGKRPMADTR